MAVYMTQFSYTTEAWQSLVKNPEDRCGILKSMIETLGGRLICIYYCYGDYDGVAIYEYPDNVTSAAGVLAVICAGHLKAAKTTVLMSFEDVVKAMTKAGDIVYPGPEG